MNIKIIGAITAGTVMALVSGLLIWHLIYGANQLLMKNKIKDFAAYMEKDIYIIPSSVNECLLLPICDGTKSPQELCADVVDVNKTLLPQDVLSNHVYKYDRNTEEIFIAA